jgi:hypothetical protein
MRRVQRRQTSCGLELSYQLRYRPDLGNRNEAAVTTPRRSRDRSALLDSVERGFQDISTMGVLLHQTVADHLGLNITDHKCMGMLVRFGPIGAGDLARQTGLTTGAITGVINRLERAGYAERRVPADRRSVVAHPVNVDGFLRRMGATLGHLRSRMRSLSERYSDEQLAFLDDFMRQAVAISREEQAVLRGNVRPLTTSGTTASGSARQATRARRRP